MKPFVQQMKVLEAAGWEVIHGGVDQFFACHRVSGRIVEHVLGEYEDGIDEEAHLRIQFNLAYEEILSCMAEPLDLKRNESIWEDILTRQRLLAS